MLSHTSSFYSPSRCAIGYFSSNQYTVSCPSRCAIGYFSSNQYTVSCPSRCAIGYFSSNQYTVSCPSRCAIGHFSSTIVINSNAFRCSTLYTRLGPVCFIIVAFPCAVMFLLLTIPSHTSVAVAGSMLNDRLIPITTSYRLLVVVVVVVVVAVAVVLVVVERSGLVRSSDNPSTSFSRRYSKYGVLSR